jgi:hypothetical protein
MSVISLGAESQEDDLQSAVKSLWEDFLVDDMDNVLWRATMFCRLCDISEDTLEEWALGLSAEFFLNIRWLPGARLAAGQLLFEEETELRVRQIITYYRQTRQNLKSINVGRIESSLSVKRKREDEQRDVFLVVLGDKNSDDTIRIVRLMKWDVLHRIHRGMPLERAIRETREYAGFIRDRLRAVSELGIQIPRFAEIRTEEKLPGIGKIPVFLYDREYILGIVSNRLPAARYARGEFILRLSGLLGRAAARCLILGRVDPTSQHIFFDDGDEVVQFDGDNLPCNIMIAETTGSFTNWNEEYERMVSHCVEHFERHLLIAAKAGVDQHVLRKAAACFCDDLIDEISMKQELLREKGPELHSLFSEYSREKGGMYCRWQGVLERLQHADLDRVREVIMNDLERAKPVNP